MIMLVNYGIRRKRKWALVPTNCLCILLWTYSTSNAIETINSDDRLILMTICSSVSQLRATIDRNFLFPISKILIANADDTQSITFKMPI